MTKVSVHKEIGTFTNSELSKTVRRLRMGDRETRKLGRFEKLLDY